MRMLTVSKNEAGQRLDKLLAKYLNLAGKSFIYKMMRKKNITLNGKKCDGSEHLTEGDEIKLFLAEETIEKFSEVKIQKVQKKKLDIVYEDEHILLINKPSGMLSQKAKETDESLVEYLIDYLLDSGTRKRTWRASVRPSATASTATQAASWQLDVLCRDCRSCPKSSRIGVWENIMSASCGES